MAFQRKGERTEDELPRQGVLGVSFNQLESIFQMPKGYHIVAAYPDAWHRSIELVIESPDFPQVPEGQAPGPIPEVDVTMTTKRFRDAGVEDYWHKVKITYRRREGPEEEERAS